MKHASRNRQLPLAFVQTPIVLRLKLTRYWQEAAERNGYHNAKAAIIGIYRDTGSTIETGRRLGMSRRTIANKLALLQEPRRGRGGNNNPYGRSGKPNKAASGTPR